MKFYELTHLKISCPSCLISGLVLFNIIRVRHCKQMSIILGSQVMEQRNWFFAFILIMLTFNYYIN